MNFGEVATQLHMLLKKSRGWTCFVWKQGTYDLEKEWNKLKT